MKKLFKFQYFETERFLEGKKFVVSSPSKVDEENGRVKLQVVITEDNTNYGTVEEKKYTKDNLFEKVYISIYSPNFRELDFKQMSEFDFGILENLRSSIFGEAYDRKLSISGDLKSTSKNKKKLPEL